MLLTGVFFVVCVVAEAIAFSGINNCEIKDGWTQFETANKTSTVAALDLDASNIKLGEPFSFTVKLCGDCEKQPDRLTANAIMPAHQHGMNYTPKVTFDEDSEHYAVSGFLFHMPGRWEITLSRYQGDDVIHYTYNVIVS